MISEGALINAAWRDAEPAPASSAMQMLEYIRHFARSHRIAPSALARKAGLHFNSLRDMHSADWSPRFDTVRKLEALIAKTEKSERTAA